MKKFTCFFVFFLILGFVGGCKEKAEPEQKKAEPRSSALSLQEFIGWLHGNCLATANSGVATGTTLTIINFDDPINVLKGKIGPKASTGENCYPLMEDREQVNRGEGFSFYQVETENSENINLAIGLLDSIEISLNTAGEPTADINADGSPDVFTQCATSEGISFAIWNTEPYQGQPLWTGYYYMGYDMEPTCPPPDEE